MAHKVKIGGTNYEVTGGRILVGATGYDVSDGNTLIDGTGKALKYGERRRVILPDTMSYYGRWLNTTYYASTYAQVSWRGIALAPGSDNVIRSIPPLRLIISGELYDANGNLVGPAQNLSIYVGNTAVVTGDDSVIYDYTLEYPNLPYLVTFSSNGQFLRINYAG